MKYWIFTGGEKNELFQQLMSDLEELDNVTLIASLPQIPASKKTLWKYHHNVKLNSKMILPFRSIWYSYMPFDEKVLKDGEHCFIFNNVSAGYFEPGLLKKWKKQYNIKLVFYFLDVYDSYYAKDARLFVKQVPFDYVYSFYQEDVKKYGFLYLDNYYSKLKAEALSNCDKEAEANHKTDNKHSEHEITSQDAFFWGTDGGRRTMIEAMAKRVHDLGFSVKAGICYTEENREESLDGKQASDEVQSEMTRKDLAPLEFIYNSPMDYVDVIKHIEKSSVILDVVGDYSKGVSLRYFESFAYNKKLITNNPLAKKMRGYDPKRILVIDTPSDITVDFFGNEEIETYQNQFSPVNWIKELDELWK